MSSVRNPIKRIYIDKRSTYSNDIIIEIELDEEMKLGYNNTKKIVLKTDVSGLEGEQSEKLFDKLCDLFGIRIAKSDMQEVTFVNMFCSDKDAKISDYPQRQPKKTGVLL